MIRELIDNEEFISLFNIRGRKILRTFVTSSEWKKDELEEVALIIEWKTTTGIICDNFTFDYDARYNRQPCIYGLRNSLIENSYNTPTSIPDSVRKAITKYFIASIFNVNRLQNKFF